MLSKLIVFILGIIIFFFVLGLIQRYRLVCNTLLSRIKEFMSSQSSNNVLSQKNQLDLVYQPTKSIFNTDEWYFFSILERISIDLSVKLFAKVPLTALLNIDKSISKAAQNSALMKIKGLHVDYIFIDIKTAKPLLVIQLENSNDNLNLSPYLMKKTVLTALMQQIHLPVLYVVIKNTYDLANIKSDIVALLKMKI